MCEQITDAATAQATAKATEIPPSFQVLEIRIERREDGLYHIDATRNGSMHARFFPCHLIGIARRVLLTIEEVFEGGSRIFNPDGPERQDAPPGSVPPFR